MFAIRKAWFELYINDWYRMQDTCTFFKWNEDSRFIKPEGQCYRQLRRVINFDISTWKCKYNESKFGTKHNQSRHLVRDRLVM